MGLGWHGTIGLQLSHRVFNWIHFRPPSGDVDSTYFFQSQRKTRLKVDHANMLKHSTGHKKLKVCLMHLNRFTPLEFLSKMSKISV